MKTIYVAGGCFWGVSHYYDQLKGVINTTVGYANGTKENPTYQEVCSQTTNHTETVKIEYDEKEISLEKVVDHLMRMIDPTTLNRQANDIGTQYRSGIYSTDLTEVTTIKQLVLSYQPNYRKPIVVEVEELSSFYEAEEYHQKYLVKNSNGYCHIDFSLIKEDEKK